MARKELTPEQLAWLIANHERPIEELADHLRLCTVTVRRRMFEHGLLYSIDAQITVASKPKSKRWSRPCLRCKCTNPRPVGQFICDACKRSASGLPDNFLFD